MKWMARMERSLGRYAVSDLTVYLVCAQAGFLILAYARQEFIAQIVLDVGKVKAGEWWRLLTFVLVPPMSFIPPLSAFALFFFYMMGTALEQEWGTFRYNVYLLIAYLATLAAAFWVQGDGITGSYIEGSIFLAFATLYPDYVIYLFLVLPIAVKWLALLTWIGFGYQLVMGDWTARGMVIAAILNYLLFFWREIIDRIKGGRRKMHRQLKRQAHTTPSPHEAFHTCATCGITDKTHPKMDFRYCPDCGGKLAYCTAHLTTHGHPII